jgi:hypothetical protein
VSIEFTCKLCGAKHPSVEKSDIGIPLLPNTITTSKDGDQKWYFHCIGCLKARSVPA